MSVHKFVDMTQTQEEAQDGPLPSHLNRYPYGLCISLCDDEIEKLGLTDENLEVGDVLHLHGFAQVTSHSSNQSMDGEKHCRIELQITHLCFEDEGEENEEVDEEEDNTPKPYF